MSHVGNRHIDSVNVLTAHHLIKSEHFRDAIFIRHLLRGFRLSGRHGNNIHVVNLLRTFDPSVNNASGAEQSPADPLFTHLTFLLSA